MLRSTATASLSSSTLSSTHLSSTQWPDGTLVFLKLGGSLITDKRVAEAPRHAVIAQLAQEIAAVRQLQPSLRLLIGHGSGSFGHVHAQQYGTHAGVHSPADWHGFALTADAAARLNRIVTGALLAAGIPAWSIQPSALMYCEDGRIAQGDAAPIVQALAHGLVPVVHGDVALDTLRGGTIASTEEIFAWLAPLLQPSRIILAGEVEGIYSADPLLEPAAQLIRRITPTTLREIEGGLGASHGVDVTGGMAAKVAQSMRLLAANPGLDVVVCSGLSAGNLSRTLLEPAVTVGTLLHGE
ncbi:MAG: isopentenyl phosphate kinase [Caldilineaceae bacterium]